MIERIILSIVFAYLTAQTCKFVQNQRRTGKWDITSYLQNGGMPSSHTATTVALTISLLIETGFSYFFIISALFSVIVMNDAMKVRRETGEEAHILNEIMAKEDIVHHRLSERVGHTPTEVFFGILLGTLSALLMYTF